MDFINSIGQSLGLVENEPAMEDFLTREQIKDFCMACFKLLEKPEVKAKLKAEHEAGRDCMDQINEYQRQVFTLINVDPEQGFKCLSKVFKVYKDDLEVMAMFSAFVQRESLAIDEAEMSPEEFAQVVNTIKAKQEEQMAMLQNMKEGHGHRYVCMYVCMYVMGFLYH